jgi:hypothetical protein
MAGSLLVVNAGRSIECYDLSKQANVASNAKDSQ